MPEYKKVGYLTTSFKMFHLKDTSRREFHYHYHDFHKILIHRYSPFFCVSS